MGGSSFTEICHDNGVIGPEVERLVFTELHPVNQKERVMTESVGGTAPATGKDQ